MEKPSGENTGINTYACACAVVGSTIAIIFGYDTGVMSGANIFIKEDLKISDSQVEILVGILNMCALVGALCAGRTSDYIGRRYTIVVAAIIFMVGSILMGYGPNYAILMLGRCTAGIGVGFALMISPVYSAEISSNSTRGILGSLTEMGISIGILLGYISNYVFARLTLKVGWRVMLGIAAIPSLALALGILKMPESPRWLIMQGRLRDGKQILDQVCNSKEDAEARFRDIKAAAGIDENCTDDVVKRPAMNRGEGVWKELLLRPTPPVRWMLLAAIGIHFFEHATGIDAVMLYGPRIFKKAGITNKDKLLLATVGIGLTKTVCILIALLSLDKVGRRPLLLTSVAGMIVALSGLGFGLTMVHHHTNGKLVWALAFSMAATYTYVAFFNIGLAPVTWVYSSEIFPSKLRAQGHAIGVAVNRLMNATISMSFLSVSKAMTTGGAFFMFAGMSVLAWFFFYFFLPETKGRTLEDMEAIFSKRSTTSPSDGAGNGIEIQAGKGPNIHVSQKG
ncbi:hypothetical protein ACSBR2_010072 [Camellia fascicularis]